MANSLSCYPNLIRAFWRRAHAIIDRDYKKAQQWDRYAMGQCSLHDVPHGKFYSWAYVYASNQRGTRIFTD